jgi:putative DNA primase/helicase
MALFIASNQPQHSTNMAGLHKSRMISVPELEDGVPWAEARIKAMTGEDKISARFMRGDNFDFYPQFKPWVSGNSKPRLRSVEEAMKRRMNLVPFLVTIPDGERDHELKEKLKAEWPGILAWFVKGCLEWQRIGLRQPTMVVEATEEYFASEDTLQTFLDDCCDIGPTFSESTASVFLRWQQFMEARGERAGSQKALTQRLKSRGFEATRETIHGRRSRVIEGLKLIDGVPLAKLPGDDTWQKDQPL